MKFYQLHITETVNDYIDDSDEYFTSLSAAMARRRELIAERCKRKSCNDFEIERIEVADLPRKRLALLLLNGRNYVTKRELVVEAFEAEATHTICPECWGDRYIGVDDDPCSRCNGEGEIHKEVGDDIS